MSSYHFAIIDGTGDWSDEDYERPCTTHFAIKFLCS